MLAPIYDKNDEHLSKHFLGRPFVWTLKIFIFLNLPCAQFKIFRVHCAQLIYNYASHLVPHWSCIVLMLPHHDHSQIKIANLNLYVDNFTVPT